MIRLLLRSELIHSAVSM